MRGIAILIEVLILMGVIYSIFLAVRLTILDVGFSFRYDRYVRWALGIVGMVIAAFFVAHLTMFYPKLLP